MQVRLRLFYYEQQALSRLPCHSPKGSRVRVCKGKRKELFLASSQFGQSSHLAPLMRKHSKSVEEVGRQVQQSVQSVRGAR